MMLFWDWQAAAADWTWMRGHCGKLPECKPKPTVAPTFMPTAHPSKTPNLDCAVSEWADWDCTTCNAGYAMRERVIVQEQSGTGAACPDLIDAEPCGGNVCPGGIGQEDR